MKNTKHSYFFTCLPAGRLFTFRFSLIVIIFFFQTNFTSTANAQNLNKFYVLGGYGYYEAAYVGLKYEGVKNSRYLVGGGYNFALGDISYSSAFIEYQRALLRLNNGSLETGIASKVIYWRQSDQYLVWGNLGLSPNLYTFYTINENIAAGLSFGPQFNFNLYNVRRNYERTGWVKPTDIEFQISISYAL
jgi:hypothetical protein